MVHRFNYEPINFFLFPGTLIKASPIHMGWQKEKILVGRYIKVPPFLQKACKQLTLWLNHLKNPHQIEKKGSAN